MAKSDLLKQAIADAKTVKETALANAKLALQEAFAPTMQRMFAEKLDAELMDEDETEAANPNAGAADTEGEDMEGNEMGGEDFTWTDDSLAASVGGKDYNFQVGMAGGAQSEPTEQPAPSDDEMQAEYNEGMDMENPEDLNLESIIRELEEDLEDPTMGHDSAEGSQLGEEEDMDMYHNDMQEDYMYEEEDDIDDIIESILRETETIEATPSDLMKTEEAEIIDNLEEELDAKEDELQEAYRTVKRLQSVINEVNLLNAKLLYTNKLFRNFELSEPQKMKVIENFDRAANPREAKLVFATLVESFKRPTKKRVVKESYASKATRTTAPTTQVLSEGFELANRWKKLAGLL